MPCAVIAHLEQADYLLIAERVLGLPAEAIANFDGIGSARSHMLAAHGVGAVCLVVATSPGACCHGAGPAVLCS